MDKYEEMAEMYLRSDQNQKLWDRNAVLRLLKEMDLRNQLFEYRVEGKLKGFMAWVYSTKEEFFSQEGKPTKILTNIGNGIMPVFVATDGDVPISFMRRIGKILTNKGPIFSFRKGRRMMIGGKHG